MVRKFFFSLQLIVETVKSASIRLLVVVAVLASMGIIVTQIFWVRRAYDLREKEFVLNIKTALRNVSTEVMKYKQIEVPIYSPVEQIEPNYFMVTTNVYVEQDVLEHFVTAALTSENVNTTYAIALYDCMSDTVEYKRYVSMPGTMDLKIKSIDFPVLKRENYYFGVLFPHRQNVIASELTFWIISTLFLLGFLLFLGYLLFIIFKQKRLSEIQKDFVNNMTHEFKTPLSSIQLSANVLKNPKIIDNPQRLLNYATIISQEAQQLTMQVERVLQMAHSGKADLDLKKEKLIWQNLIQQVSESFTDRIAEKQGQLILSLPETPVSFYGDELHFRNVLSNLLDNAIKYTEAPPVIEIVLKMEKEETTIAVIDNGIGISEPHQKMLFNKFYRVPTGNIHNVKGFGLGLDYVKTITKAHGGEVKCISKKGEGSKFVLIFPI